VVSEDGSRVFRQANPTVDTAAWAGSGSGPFTVVTARVKPTTSTGTVALLSKVANPNNFYYVALRAGQLEIGRRSFGTVSSLASAPFPANAGTWYTLSLNLFFTGTIRGSVSTPTGQVTVSAADPGGTNFGGAVGFWTVNATASFDDIVLSDDRVVTSTSRPPSVACPVTVTYTILAQWPGGFQAGVMLRNVSPVLIQPGWVLTFRFVGGEIVTNMFSVSSWRQIGPLVTVTGPPWGGMSPGGTFQFGFLGTTAQPPRGIVDVTFNGIPC
jgi:hypothetical protein